MSLRARMRKLGRALASPVALLTAAALLLVLLVWFLGPLITFAGVTPLGSATMRLAIVLAIVLAWGIAGYFIRVKRSSEDQALIAALRRQQDEERLAAEQMEADSESRFNAYRDAARGALRLAGRGRSGGPLGRDRYQLPWYLVLGIEGSGKSSLVRNSGLVLPYEGEAESNGIADFHITDQAVLVEVDGRFLDPPEQSTSTLWLRMLDHLRRQRPQQPVNGVIVTVGAGELMAMSPEAVLDFSSTVRRRLDEAVSRLRTRAPVYVVVTKLDLLVGFEAFFEGLSADERAMPLGLPLGPQAGGTPAAGSFADGFDALVERLSNQLLFRLQEEPDELRRRRLFEFPSHFAALRDVLEPFAAYLTAQHRFDAPPQLRGLFFASAAQKGGSVDMLTPGLAADFAQQPRNLALHGDVQEIRGRPFFLREFFRGIVLPEASLGGLTRPAAMMLKAQGMAANVLLTIAALALVAFWWLAFSEGRAYTARLEQGVAAARASLAEATPEGRIATDFGPVLAALDDLRALATEEPRRATFGLYGTAGAEEAAREAYHRGIAGMLVPYVWRYLRDDIADPGVAAARRFAQLKLYLMMVGERPVDPLAASVLAPDFSARWLPYDATERTVTQVTAHLAELASIDMPPLLNDMPLVDRARGLLSDYTLARLAYDAMTAMPAIRQLPVWRPVDNMGLAGPQALARVSGASFWDGVPGQFTQDGFRDTVLPASGAAAKTLVDDLWVMGTPPATVDFGAQEQRLRDGLLDLYRVDYIRMWDSLLSDLAMAEGVDAGAVARAMAILIGKPSPARELLGAIAGETDLTPADSPLGALPGAAAARVDRIDRIAGSVRSPRRVIDVAAQVTEHFRGLHDAVAAEEGQQSQVDAMLAALEPLYQQINHIASGGDILELGAEPQSTLNQLGEQVDALPPTLQPLFRRILAQAAAVTGGSSRERLSEIWSTTVLPACRATTDRRYPFDPGADADTSIADFASLMGPNGLIAGFRNDYLRPYIDTTASPWRWRTGQQVGLGLDPEVLAAFELAERIAIAYFGGAETPQVDFTVEPVRLDPEARAFQFDVGGPTLVYTHGPPSPAPFAWPPERVAADAMLSVTPEIQGERNLIRRQGPWALFRLFDAGRIMRPDSTDVVPYLFNVGSREVVVNVTAPATRNPFARDILSDFECPVL